MSQEQLAKNTMFLTAASVGQKIIAFLYFTLIAGYLGTTDTGAYFLALALVTTIAVLEDMGMTSVLIREVARRSNGAKEWLRAVLGMKVVTIPLAVVVAIVLPYLLGYSGEVVGLVRIALGVMIADTLSLTFYGVLRAQQNLRYESLGIFVGQAFTAVIGLALVATGQATLASLIVALVAGSVWNMAFSAWQVGRRLGAGAFVPAYSMGWQPLRIGFAFFLAAVFVKIYSYVDSFILNAQIGQTAVGIYSVAYKLTYAFQFLPLAFVGALYPTMSAAAHEPERLRKIFFSAEWYVSLLAAPIVFGIWALAPEIIAFFYPREFAPAAGPLMVLIFALIPIFLDFPIGSLLNATQRQMQKTSIMGLTMIVNIAANVLFIPRLGIPGASLAAVISFVFMFAAGWWCARSSLNATLWQLVREVGGFYIAGGIMAVAVVMIKDTVGLIPSVVIGGAVYMVGIVALRSFTAEHLAQAKAIIRRKV